MARCIALFLLALLLCAPSVRAQIEPQPPNEQTHTAARLNHVYLVLEPETYQAILRSEFIVQSFAASGEYVDVSATLHSVSSLNQAAASPTKPLNKISSKTPSADRTAPATETAMYCFGQDTYIEFYHPNKTHTPHTNMTGNSGIIFGFDEEGAAALFHAALQRTDSLFNGTTSITLIKQSLPRQMDIPRAYCVHTAYQTPAQPRFQSWALEYHQAYLRSLYSDCRTEEDGITRRQYLMRRYDTTKLLNNLSSVCLALDSLEARRFLRELKAGGYTVREGKREINAIPLQQGNTTPNPNAAAAGGVLFRIIPATSSRHGVIELRFRLNRSVPHQIYSFGENSTLLLDENEAVWTF